LFTFMTTPDPSSRDAVQYAKVSSTAIEVGLFWLSASSC